MATTNELLERANGSMVVGTPLRTTPQALDLTSWTKIMDVADTGRLGVMISNSSSNPLMLIFVGPGDSDPSGSSTADLQTFVLPGEVLLIGVGPKVAIWGLHGVLPIAGATVLEFK